MVLVYVPIFAQTKSHSHVGKYTIQRADGLDELRQYAAHEFQRQNPQIWRTFDCESRLAISPNHFQWDVCSKQIWKWVACSLTQNKNRGL